MDTIFIMIVIFFSVCAVLIISTKKSKRNSFNRSNEFRRTQAAPGEIKDQLKFTRDIVDRLREEPTQTPVNAEFKYRKKSVMTATEQRLFKTLVEITKDDFLILAQVDLKSIISEDGNDQSKTAFYKITQKSIDFLLCDKDGVPIAAIELQDWTHNRADRQKSDRDKAAALESAGIPLIEFHAKNLPTAEGAAQMLLPAIERWKREQSEMGS